MAMTGEPGLLRQRIHPHPLGAPRATETSWGWARPRVGPQSMPGRLLIGPQKPSGIDEGPGEHRAMAADRLPIARESREVRAQDTRGAILHPHPRIRTRRAAGNEQLFAIMRPSVATGGPAPGRSGRRAGHTARPPTPRSASSAPPCFAPTGRVPRVRSALGSDGHASSAATGRRSVVARRT